MYKRPLLVPKIKANEYKTFQLKTERYINIRRLYREQDENQYGTFK